MAGRVKILYLDLRANFDIYGDSAIELFSPQPGIIGLGKSGNSNSAMAKPSTGAQSPFVYGKKSNKNICDTLERKYRCFPVLIFDSSSIAIYIAFLKNKTGVNVMSSYGSQI